MCVDRIAREMRLYALFVFIMCEICHEEYPNKREIEFGIVTWVKSWHNIMLVLF